MEKSKRQAWVFGEGLAEDGLQVDRLVAPFDARGHDASDRSAWLPITAGEAAGSDAAGFEDVWVEEMEASSAAPGAAAQAGLGSESGDSPGVTGVPEDESPEGLIPEALPLEDLELEVVPRIAPP